MPCNSVAVIRAKLEIGLATALSTDGAREVFRSELLSAGASGVEIEDVVGGVVVYITHEGEEWSVLSRNGETNLSCLTSTSTGNAKNLTALVEKALIPTRARNIVDRFRAIGSAPANARFEGNKLIFTVMLPTPKL